MIKQINLGTKPTPWGNADYLLPCRKELDHFCLSLTPLLILLFPCSVSFHVPVHKSMTVHLHQSVLLLLLWSYSILSAWLDSVAIGKAFLKCLCVSCIHDVTIILIKCDIWGYIVMKSVNKWHKNDHGIKMIYNHEFKLAIKYVEWHVTCPAADQCEALVA